MIETQFQLAHPGRPAAGSTRRLRNALAAALLLAAAPAVSQETDRPIQDNSFLIEEAYNQEAGVVQHIQLLLYDWKSKSWAWTFTQEWPVPDETHQLSYTVLLSRVEHDGGADTGLGDFALHYRYQLIGDGDARVAVAPRLTVFFPTGSYAKSLGAGSVGVQAGIPASVVLSDRFVAHANVGALWTPGSRDPQGHRARLLVPFAGASLVFLARDNWNALVEGLWVRTESVAGENSVAVRETAFISPGIRYAWTLKSGLQVVAGLGAPMGVGPSRGQYSVLAYLSFEHPLWRGGKR